MFKYLLPLLLFFGTRHLQAQAGVPTGAPAVQGTNRWNSYGGPGLLTGPLTGALAIHGASSWNSYNSPALLNNVPVASTAFNYGNVTVTTVITTTNGGQGLVADGTYFYTGKENGTNDGTITKYTYSGTYVAQWAGPPHANDGDIRADDGNQLWVNAADPPNTVVWEITNTGTVVNRWSFTGFDYTSMGGGMIAYAGPNQIFLATASSGYTQLDIRLITLGPDGTYTPGPVWTGPFPIRGEASQSIKYQNGIIFFVSGGSQAFISELALLPHGSIAVLGTQQVINAAEGEGLAWDGSNWYLEDGSLTIHKVGFSYSGWRSGEMYPDQPNINTTQPVIIGPVWPLYPLDTANPSSLYITAEGEYSVPSLIGMAADETGTNVAPVVAGQVLIGIYGEGTTTPYNLTGNVSAIREVAGSNFTPTNGETYVDIATTPLNSTSRTIRAYFNSDGSMNLGATQTKLGAGVFSCSNIDLQSLQTTSNGSVAGTVVASMPFAGPSYKKVMFILNGFNGTATYTSPTPFSSTNVLISSTLSGIVTMTGVNSFSISTSSNTTTVGSVEGD